MKYVMPKYGKTIWLEDNLWSEIILNDIYNTLYKDEAHDSNETEVAKENEDMTIFIMKGKFLSMVEFSKATVKDYTKQLVTDDMVNDEDDSSNEGVFGDEYVVLFNDVKYPLIDIEIRMFKERPTTSRALTRKLASTSTRSRAPSTRSRAPITSTSTRYRAPIASTSIRSRAPTSSTSTFKASTRSKALTASTSNAQDASTLDLRGYMKIAMIGCVLGLRIIDDPNAPPSLDPQKRKVKCMVANDKPQEENGVGGIAVGEDKYVKKDATEVIWKSFNNVVKVLVKTIVISALLGLFLLCNHRNGYLALAASGGRVGGRSFSSFSKTKSSSSSGSSSSSSSRASSSDSSSSRSYSSPSSSSYLSSSSSPSSSSYSSSSSYKSSPKSSYSRKSSPESSSYESSSTWWNSSPESSSTSSNTWASSPKSSSYESYNTQSQTSSPASSSSSLSGFIDFLCFTVIILLIVYMLCQILTPPDYPSKKETRSHVDREKDTFKTSVLRVQVGLLGTAKSLQKDLDQMAELADTSTSEGLSSVLQEATLVLLRHSNYCISGYSSADKKRSVDECEELFNKITIQERGQFDVETLVNISIEPSKYFNLKVTIVAAVFGLYGLPDVKTTAELKTALEKMASIPSSKIMAAEVLWTPQKQNDTLSEREYRRDYDAKRERLETVNNKTPNRWLTKEKADSIEEDVDLKRKRAASQRRTLQRRKRGGRERTIRGTTIERETFREDHKIGGSRQRFEMPFKVT
nr:myelin-associated oligodendrocyte basic protein isoform 1 [Tanacetum cinerariifolium]